MDVLTTDEPGLQLRRARMRVDGAEHAPRLRDYFLRLGCVAAAIPGSADVAVMCADSEVDLLDATAVWIRANMVGVTILEESGESEPAASEPQTAPEPTRPKTAPPKVQRPAGIASRQPGPRIGDMLVKKGMISEAQLRQALDESRSTGARLGEILLEHRWVFEDELARTLAEQWNVPYINAVSVGVDRGAVQTLKPEIGMQYGVIPVRFSNSGVMVAFADPSDDEAYEAVAAAVGPPTLAVAELSMIRMLWRRFAQS